MFFYRVCHADCQRRAGFLTGRCRNRNLQNLYRRKRWKSATGIVWALKMSYMCSHATLQKSGRTNVPTCSTTNQGNRLQSELITAGINTYRRFGEGTLQGTPYIPFRHRSQTSGKTTYDTLHISSGSLTEWPYWSLNECIFNLLLRCFFPNEPIGSTWFILLQLHVT